MENHFTLNLDQGTAIINLPKLRPKHVRQLNYLDLINKIGYIESLRGAVHRVSVKRFKVTGEDPLALGAGRFQRMFNMMFDYSPSTKLVPETIKPGNALGIEIECYVPFSDGRDECLDKIERVLKKHKAYNVRVAEDGSLTDSDGDYYGFEFRVLCSINNLAPLERTCAALKELKAYANKDCGLHVHIDGRDTTPGKLAARLVRALPLLKKMVPASRSRSSYCEADVSSPGKRYAKINKESYKKHKTVEVRLHTGTVDYEKISNWCKILYSIAKTRKVISKDRAADPIYMASRYGWTLPLVNYIETRIAKFAPPPPPTPQEIENSGGVIECTLEELEATTSEPNAA